MGRPRLRRSSGRTPRETLANLSITGHLRCFSDQPVAEIVQCGEVSFTCRHASVQRRWILNRRLPEEDRLKSCRRSVAVGCHLLADRDRRGGCLSQWVANRSAEFVKSFRPMQRRRPMDAIANAADTWQAVAVFVSGQHLLVSGGGPARWPANRAQAALTVTVTT